MHIYTALLYNIIYIYNIKSTYITFCGVVVAVTGCSNKNAGLAPGPPLG